MTGRYPVVSATGFFIITFDITHLAQTGKNVVNFYERNRDRIVNIHFSDYRKKFINTHLLLTTDTHLELGKGQLPINRFLQTLKQDHYKGLITMEINSNLEGLCKSARIIKKVIK